jgi:hypothetical protein
MAMTPEYEISSWTDAVANLHQTTVNGEDAQLATHAAAMLWSGQGLPNAPAGVLQMLAQATEAGYAAALHDLRRGHLDEEVRSWRPELFEQ